MRHFIWVLFLTVLGVCAPRLSLATPVEVGGLRIELSPPAAMVELTAADPGLYAVRDLMVPPANRQLGMYLFEEDLVATRVGGMPNFLRYGMAQVSRKGEALNVTPLQFAVFREVMKRQQDEIMRQAQQTIESLLQDSSRKISGQIGAKMDVSVEGLTNLPAHINDKDMYAFSLRGAQQVKVGNYAESRKVTGTATLLLVRGKMLYLFLYGGENDLEWTRAESRKWADRILTTNRP